MAALEKLQHPVSAPEGEKPAESIAPVTSSAQLDVAQKLEAAIAEARGAEGVEQEKLADDVNAALRLLRETSAARRAADVLLGHLHKRSFGKLTGTDGRTCRSVAVEQLLALGFPFALEVMPEDLEHHRAQERPLSGTWKVLLLLLAAFAVGYPLYEYVPQLLSPALFFTELPFAAGIGAMTSMTSLLLITQRPASRRAKWLRRILWASGAVGLTIGALYTQSFATFPAGAAAVVAATLLKPRSEPDDEEDAA